VKSIKRQSAGTKQEAVKRALKEATVRVGAVLAIPDVLRKPGADPVEVLAEAGVDIKLFDAPDNLISYAKRATSLTECTRLSPVLPATCTVTKPRRDRGGPKKWRRVTAPKHLSEGRAAAKPRC